MPRSGLRAPRLSPSLRVPRDLLPYWDAVFLSPPAERPSVSERHRGCPAIPRLSSLLRRCPGNQRCVAGRPGGRWLPSSAHWQPSPAPHGSGRGPMRNLNHGGAPKQRVFARSQRLSGRSSGLSVRPPGPPGGKGRRRDRNRETWPPDPPTGCETATGRRYNDRERFRTLE